MTLTTLSYLMDLSALITTAVFETSAPVEDFFCACWTFSAKLDSVTGVLFSLTFISKASFLPRMIWMTTSGCLAALPMLGKSIMLGLIKGAVTMKIIKSTSITSMNGTILGSLIVRRPRPRELTAGIVQSFASKRESH